MRRGGGQPPPFLFVFAKKEISTHFLQGSFLREELAHDRYSNK